MLLSFSGITPGWYLTRIHCAWLMDACTEHSFAIRHQTGPLRCSWLTQIAGQVRRQSRNLAYRRGNAVNAAICLPGCYLAPARRDSGGTRSMHRSASHMLIARDDVDDSAWRTRHTPSDGPDTDPERGQWVVLGCSMGALCKPWRS
jgi:hypothetical protein